VIVRNLRRRVIPWTDVAAIHVESSMGVRAVALYEFNGNRTRLRMPVTGFLYRDRRFEEKARVIYGWWYENRASWAVAVESGRAGGFSGKPERLRARPVAAQRWLIAMLLICVATDVQFGTTLVGSGSGHRPLPVRIAGVLVSLTVLAGIWQWAVRPGITLTPGALLARHKLGRRELAWSDIQAFEIERRRRGHRLVVLDNRGRRTRLACPRNGFLLAESTFDFKAQTIHYLWLERRGADWADADPAGPADPRAGGLELIGSGPVATWKQVVLGIVGAALGYEVLVSLLVFALGTAFNS